MIYDIPISVPIQIIIKDEQGATLQWRGNEGYFVKTIPGLPGEQIFFPTPSSCEALERRFNCNPRAMMEGRMR